MDYEYLPLLQDCHSWNKKKNLVPGDNVLVADSTAPHSSWLMGTVQDTFANKQGLVRAAGVKTKNSVLERPITKLYLLQVAQ